MTLCYRSNRSFRITQASPPPPSMFWVQLLISTGTVSPESANKNIRSCVNNHPLAVVLPMIGQLVHMPTNQWVLFSHVVFKKTVDARCHSVLRSEIMSPLLPFMFCVLPFFILNFSCCSEFLKKKCRINNFSFLFFVLFSLFTTHKKWNNSLKTMK